MGNRVAEIVVICEDSRHQSLLNFYFARWPVETGKFRWLKSPGGSAEQWVRDTWVRELSAYRSVRVHRRAALLAIIDADIRSVADRLRQFDPAPGGLQGDDKNVAVLVPRRHVETWILAMGHSAEVNEEDRYDRDRRVDRSAVRRAADRLYELSRPNAASQGALLPSISTAISVLRSFEEGLRQTAR